MYSRACVFTVLLFFLSLLGYISPNVKFENGDWLGESNPHRLDKEYFNDSFIPHQNNLVLLISLPQSTIINTSNLDALRTLTTSLEKIPNIISVKTPLNARLFTNKKDAIEFSSFETLFESSDYTLSHYKTDLLNSDYYKSTVSADLQSFLVILDIEIPSESDRVAIYRTTINKINILLNNNAPFNQYYISGMKYIEDEINLHNIESLSNIIPLVFCFIFALVYLVFRKIIYALMVLTTVLASILYTLSVFALTSFEITTVSTILITLILIIALSDALYILNIWNLEVVNQQNKYALRTTIIKSWKPCLVTSFTTTLGFGTFYFSELLPFKELAIVSVFSIMGNYLVITLCTWALIYVFGAYIINSQDEKNTIFIDGLLEKIASLSHVKNRILIFGLLTVHLLIGIAYLTIAVDVESNTTDHFLRNQSPAYTGFQRMNKEFYAYNNIELIFKSNEIEFFKKLDNFQRILRIGEELSKHPQVGKVQSYSDLVSRVHQKLSKSSQYPNDQTELSQELLFLEFMSDGEVDDLMLPYIDFDYSSARIQLKIKEHLKSSEIKEILELIRSVSEQQIDIEPLITGDEIYSYHLSNYLLNTQIISILLLCIGITIVFILLFGMRLGFVCVVANILPMMLVMGTLALFSIPFDFSVILTLCINFGLMVDMSIHVLYHFIYSSKNTRTYESSTVIEESSTDIEKPSTVIEKPLTDIEKPSTVIEESSTVIEESSTVIEESSTVIEKPSTDIEKSSTVIEKPSTVLNESTIIKNVIIGVGKPILYIATTMLFCYSLFAHSEVFLLHKFGALSILYLISAVLISLLVVPSMILFSCQTKKKQTMNEYVERSAA